MYEPMMPSAPLARCDRGHIKCSHRVEMEALHTELLQCVLSRMCVSLLT